MELGIERTVDRAYRKTEKVERWDVKGKRRGQNQAGGSGEGACVCRVLFSVS